MSFFSHLKRLRARRLEISILDREISSLYETKTKLSVEVERLRNEQNNLKEKIKQGNEFVSLTEKIATSKEALDSLNSEIESETKTLANLRKEHNLVLDYTALSANLADSLDKSIQELFKKYPNLKVQKFSILPTNSYILVRDIKIAIDAQLTKFAITHNIDPDLYKNLMYRYNASWLEEYNNFAKNNTSVKSNYNYSSQFLDSFLVLID